MKNYKKRQILEELEEKTRDMAFYEQFADDCYLDEDDNEDNFLLERDSLKVPCELIRDDTLEIGLNADGSVFITVVGANAEYTIVPSRENLKRINSQMSKLLYITEGN